MESTTETTTKAVTKELSTFLKWGLEEQIGYKTIELHEKKIVIEIWCKICAKHETKIQDRVKPKGAAIASLKAFTAGTNVVTKYQVERHLDTKIHKAALELESQIGNVPQNRKRPTSIDSAIKFSAREEYVKLMRTAWNLACTPSMPHSQFTVLVKCQRDNGIQLIDGKDNNKAARDFIYCIADVIREEVAAVVTGNHFFSLFTDSLQSRKTNGEKELVLVRTKKNGIPVYFVLSLIEMTKFGGCYTNLLRTTINSLFIREGRILLDEKRISRLISTTSDGANANMGVYDGALTQLKADHPWLVLIRCANHRSELAIKGAMKSIPKFEECDSLYTSIYYLYKSSRKLKTETQKACKVFDITYYHLPKIHNTRFVNHRRRGFTKLLHLWPAIIVVFKNAIDREQDYRPETRAKIQGVLKKLVSYKYVCQTAVYLDVLESMSPLSLIFEANLLMAYDIQPAVEQTLANLEEMAEEEEDDTVTSFLRKFSIRIENGLVKLVAKYPKAGHENKKPANREFVYIEIDDIISWDNATEVALELRSEAIAVLHPLIKDRFSSITDNKVFKSCKWIDPQFWEEDRSKNGKEEIEFLLKEFSLSFETAGLEKEKVMKEWKSVQTYIKTSFDLSSFLPWQIWKTIFEGKQNEYSNILMLVELVMCLSSSSSSVERGFNILTTILSDGRLNMNHDTMEDCLVIVGNKDVWSAGEKERIILKATERYMSGKRRTKSISVPAKVACVDIYSDEEACADSDDEYDSSSSCFDSETMLESDV